MYDQLAGGFARYSVDARWVVPHFEKMLYDNALLLRVYAHLAPASPARRWPLRVADETAAFLLRDLRTAEGGFASALDADTDGVEGLTYAWTPAQLREVLGRRGRGVGGASCSRSPTRARSSTAPRRCSCTPTPTTRRAGNGCGPRCWPPATGRPQPARDDKVVTAWNGLAIVALAEAGAALDRPAWVAAAARAAELLLERHVVDGRLRRSSRDGVVGAAAGVLEDHAALADGLLALHQATGAPALARGRDRPARRDPRALRRRPMTASSSTPPTTPRRCCTGPARSPTTPRPCGSSALAAALLTASVLTDDGGRYRDAAEAALHGGGHPAARAPAVRRPLAHRGRGAARGPAAGRGRRRPGRSSLACARRVAPGGTVIVAGEPDAPGVPLLAARPLVDGAAGGLRLPRLRLRPPRHDTRRTWSAGRSPAANATTP